MENYLIFLSGTIFSCLVNTIIIFQYINERYSKKYKNKIGYIFLEIFVSIVLILINLLKNPILNIMSWIVISDAVAIILYSENEKSKIQKIFELTVLVLILSVCETFGFIILKHILWKLNVGEMQPLIVKSLSVIFSKLVVIAIYCSLILRLWKPTKRKQLNLERYGVYVVIVLYSVLNLSLILTAISQNSEVTSGKMILLLINIFWIVFVNLFFLYFTKFVEESDELRLRLQLLNQQAELQYKYYYSQQEKYNNSIKILHDVNKHLRMIEKMYEKEEKGLAKEYTKEIKEILAPLVAQQYTNNPILNILLDDKKKYAALHHISFKLEVGNVDLGFMSSVEITTLFGNLLDNAIEANKNNIENKFIDMKLDTYNKFVAIHISNSTKCTQQKIWKNGKPDSVKGENHGIGLINVENIVKKYDGSMILEEENGIFNCEIIING